MTTVQYFMITLSSSSVDTPLCGGLKKHELTPGPSTLHTDYKYWLTLTISSLKIPIMITCAFDLQHFCRLDQLMKAFWQDRKHASGNIQGELYYVKGLLMTCHTQHCFKNTSQQHTYMNKLIMKRKFKQRWSTIPPVSTKRTSFMD